MEKEEIIPSLLCQVENIENEPEKYMQVKAERNEKKRRKCWVNPVSKTRKTEGEFATIFKKLEKDKVKFRNHFNMSYEKFIELLEIITPHIVKKNTTFRSAVTPKERLAVCLRYLATGDSFKNIATNYRLGLSTVHSIINDTCKGIWTALSPIVMPQPTEEMWNNIERGFHEKWNFPNCLGVLDGRQIVVQTPKSYEKTFSIILLALIDNNSKFVIIDVGDFDKINEGGTFTNSMLGKLLTSGILKLPEDKPLFNTKSKLPHVFIGDNMFPLKKNLLRSYAKKQVENDISKISFNSHLNHARKVSHLTFGMLIQNYQVYQKKLQMKPDNVENLILATCCLHNFLRDESTEYGNINMGLTQSVGVLPHVGGNATTEAYYIRDQFKNYFSTIKSELQDEEFQIEIKEDACKVEIKEETT